ncbi:hypothetical protein GJAV_G00269490 [Gymnothorax javanicus]|nr:hypothetical protein GJAV_G00269490 [Gymnothorax javanicus]
MAPLTDLGLGLGEGHLSDERARELTDDFALPCAEGERRLGRTATSLLPPQRTEAAFPSVGRNLPNRKQGRFLQLCPHEQCRLCMRSQVCARTGASPDAYLFLISRAHAQVLFQLFVGQSSEFFRRLALLLSTSREEKGRLAYRATAEVTEPLHLALRGCLGDLRRSYDLHRCSEMRRGTRDSDGADRARRHCRELGALHASVQNLQMHLRALLNEVIMLEDELEMLLVSPETADAASATALWDKLRLLRPHMHASRGCWEEAVTHVGRMVRLSSSQSGTPGTPDESAPQLPSSAPHPVSHNWDKDSVPEEQELEAYASDSDSDSDWRGDLSSAEQNWRRRGREESRPVLLELKSVLGLRASEGERRKWKQLLFRDQAALSTTLPREPLEPCGSSDPREPCSQQNNHEFTTLCASEARLNYGCSEGETAPPVPHTSTAHEGGKERALPSGRSLNAGFEGQAEGPPKSCTTDTIHHQKGGTDLWG